MVDGRWGERSRPCGTDLIGGLERTPEAAAAHGSNDSRDGRLVPLGLNGDALPRRPGREFT